MIDSHTIIPRLHYTEDMTELDRIKYRLQWLRDIGKAKRQYSSINVTIFTEIDEVEVNKHIVDDLEYLVNLYEECCRENN